MLLLEKNKSLVVRDISLCYSWKGILVSAACSAIRQFKESFSFFCITVHMNEMFLLKESKGIVPSYFPSLFLRHCAFCFLSC